MNNIMIDIETLGRKPGCVVLSIGAVYFDPRTGETGPEFYEEISLKDSLKNGYTIDPETLQWYASEGLTMPVHGTRMLPDVLNELKRFVMAPNTPLGELANSKGNDPIIWANSPAFDLEILSYAYGQCGWTESPWQYWNVRDVRTLVKVAGIDKTNRYNTHNALMDCKNQISWVVDAFKKYNF